MTDHIDDDIPSAFPSCATGNPDVIVGLEPALPSTVDITTSGSDAVRAGDVGIWQLDLQNETLATCSICCDIYDCDAGVRLDLDRFVGAVHPDDRDARAQAIDAAISSGKTFDVEFRIHTEAGTERWVQMRGGLLRHADGGLQALAGILIDITPRKQADEQRALVAEELEHRIKNNMMLIQAIVGQTLRSSRSMTEARTALEARLFALGSSGARLMKGDERDALMIDVLRDALTPFGFGSSAAFHWAGPELSLPARIAVALGLAIHELAMNAVKYGALSVPDGEVRIIWSVTDGDEGRCFHFTWEERGGPTITKPVGVGFGSRLIQQCLERRLGGHMVAAYCEQGLNLAARIPLAP